MSTLKSAEAVTLVVTLAVLFAMFGSGVVAAIDAVLVRVEAFAGAVTTMVKVVEEPVAQAARVQVTEVLPALVQVQPPLEALTLTKVTPAGRVSVTVTFAAFDGPLLLAPTV